MRDRRHTSIHTLNFELEEDEKELLRNAFDDTPCRLVEVKIICPQNEAEKLYMKAVGPYDYLTSSSFIQDAKDAVKPFYNLVDPSKYDRGNFPVDLESEYSMSISFYY